MNTKIALTATMDQVHVVESTVIKKKMTKKKIEIRRMTEELRRKITRSSVIIDKIKSLQRDFLFYSSTVFFTYSSQEFLKSIFFSRS